MEEISAGGVVYRHTDSGVLKIQMIVDRYGKMTLAKGKQEDGETIEETALREIQEETGVQGKIVAPLAVVRYTYSHQDGKRVDKRVHYFLVETIAGTLQAQWEEIQEVGWFTPTEVWENQRQNGYANNDEVIARALELLEVDTNGA